ncbi:MAG TPA: hypothetical protein VGX92_19340 [Pyrinomonadaceae bacterium]|jgi:F0F1-type ATP synthase membrane subunit c/vacuolar-type H+-ATPase subunit K|nr:hypothetical protein [Pyrinomonadaceae bacterium]
MNPIDRVAETVNVDGRYRTMLIVWFAILMSTVMMFFLTLMIERTSNDSGGPLVWILLALGVSTLALSFVLKRKVIAQAVGEQRPELVQSAMILALALCETSSLFGLLAFFVSNTPYYNLFFILGVVGFLLHLPRRDQLLAASYKARGLE